MTAPVCIFAVGTSESHNLDLGSMTEIIILTRYCHLKK